MIYREATEKDLEQIVNIENAVMPLPWSFCSFHEATVSDHTLFLVAEQAKTIVGYLVVYLTPPEAELPDIVVAKDYQGQGIGSLLLDKAIGKLKASAVEELFLEVRTSNAPAIHLYEKKGFTQIGIRKNFYSKPVEDAICMKLSL